MATATSPRGFATVNFYAADLDAAKKWYSEVFEIPAYFEKPGYIEFRVGDYEHHARRGFCDGLGGGPVR